MVVKLLRLIIGFFLAVFAVVVVAMCLGAIILPFFHADLAAELAGDGKGIATMQAIVLIEGVLLGIAILLGMVEYFFLLLWRVLGSIEGDPFIPANSVRISRMAWTALAANLWAIVFGVYVAWAQTFIADAIEGADFNVDFGGGGLVLILVLFVLARVFEHGTQMRADLDGTV